MNRTPTALERLYRTFEAVDDSVRKLESNPNSKLARRALTHSLEPFLLSFPAEERGSLVELLDRVRHALPATAERQPLKQPKPILKDLAYNPLMQDAYERREALVKKGELLRSDELQKRLGVSRQAISKRIGSGTLFYVDGNGGARYYPAFFADPALDLAKVKRVCKLLAPLSGAAKWLFFTSPRYSLGGVAVLDVIKGVHAEIGDHTDVTERHQVGFEDVLRLACAESQR